MQSYDVSLNKYSINFKKSSDIAIDLLQVEVNVSSVNSIGFMCALLVLSGIVHDLMAFASISVRVY